MILAISEGVFINMRIVEPNLVIFDPRKRITDLALAGPQRFNFCSVQNNARFKGFQNVVIPPGFRIVQDIGHKEKARRDTSGLRFPPEFQLAAFFLFRRLTRFGRFGQFEIHFVLDDFKKRNIGGTHSRGIRQQRASLAVGQLPDSS